MGPTEAAPSPAKIRGSQPGGEAGAEEIAEGSGEDGEQAGLGVEEEGDGAFAGSERAHEADLGAAFEDGGGHGGADGESGGEQGGGADEPHEAADAFEDVAFVLLDAADLLGLRAGDGFANLVGDGVGVGAAVPDLVLLRRERVGVFAGEGVFGFGAGGDVDAGDGIGKVGETSAQFREEGEVACRWRLRWRRGR